MHPLPSVTHDVPLSSAPLNDFVMFLMAVLDTWRLQQAGRHAVSSTNINPSVRIGFDNVINLEQTRTDSDGLLGIGFSF